MNTETQNASPSAQLNSGPPAPAALTSGNQHQNGPSRPAPALDPGLEAQKLPARRHRNGTIARLPREIRQRINDFLDDGLPYADIIEKLGEHGQHLVEDHIRRWRRGGYQDHLREQRLIDQCRARQARAFELLRNAQPINAFQATQQISTAQICAAMADFGGDTLREALLANPLNYFRMLNSFARLTNGGLKCERHLGEEAERKARLERERQPEPKRGISPETLKQMQDKLNLMLTLRAVR